MTDPIALTGLTPIYRVPAILVQIGFAQGSASGNTGTRPTVFVMPKSSSGTWTVNTLYWPRSEADVIAGAGRGSPLHRAWKMANRVAPGMMFGCIPYAETSGGSPTTASSTTTFSGTATGETSVICQIAELTVNVAVHTGDTANTVAGNIRAAAATLADGPVVTSGSTNSVTYSSRIAGASSGTNTYSPIKIVWNTPGNGITITPGGNVGATVAGADGTTTEAANLLAALNANSGVWMYNIVSHLGNDSTALSNAANFLLNQALPLAGKRGTLIVSSGATQSAASTLALGCNYERISFPFGAPYIRETPAQIAAWTAAIFAKYEETDRTFNFDNYFDQDCLLTPVDDTTQYPDGNDSNDQILGGLMPLGIKNGKVGIIKATTTRVKDATGTYTDFRAYERHRVSGADDCGDKVQVVLAQAMAKQKLRDHVKLPNGQPDPNYHPPRGVVTPFTLTPKVQKVLRDQDADGQAQRLDEMLASLQLIRSTDNVGRVLCSFNYYTIDLADQAATYIAESTPG